MVGVDERPPLIAITGGEWNDLPHCTADAPPSLAAHLAGQKDHLKMLAGEYCMDPEALLRHWTGHAANDA